jgi:hypothetical protein
MAQSLCTREADLESTNTKFILGDSLFNFYILLISEQGQLFLQILNGVLPLTKTQSQLINLQITISVPKGKRNAPPGKAVIIGQYQEKTQWLSYLMILI